MFSPNSNDNLIKENAVNIAENKLFSFGDVENNSLYNPKKIEKKSAFASLASIAVTDVYNPLEKNVYNYSFSSATAVRGMAYASKNSGIVNNPLSSTYNIVDNSYEFNRTIANNDFNDILNITKAKHEIDSTRVEIKPIAENTFNMTDILAETDSSQIIDFIKPKNMALTKVTKMNAFWAKQRNMIENLKKMFIVKKEKIR